MAKKVFGLDASAAGSVDSAVSSGGGGGATFFGFGVATTADAGAGVARGSGGGRWRVGRRDGRCRLSGGGWRRGGRIGRRRGRWRRTGRRRARLCGCRRLSRRRGGGRRAGAAGAEVAGLAGADAPVSVWASAAARHERRGDDRAEKQLANCHLDLNRARARRKGISGALADVSIFACSYGLTTAFLRRRAICPSRPSGP